MPPKNRRGGRKNKNKNTNNNNNNNASNASRNLTIGDAAIVSANLKDGSINSNISIDSITSPQSKKDK